MHSGSNASSSWRVARCARFESSRIAHRLSTIVNADKIFFIDGGGVLASGTHTELMETCDKYRELYQAEQVDVSYETVKRREVCTNSARVSGRCVAMPLLTVIVPAYNCASYLHECLESVLGQVQADCELVVVDDGSTDDTRDVLASYQSATSNVKVLYREHKGASAARNAGLEAASGAYVSFLEHHAHLPAAQRRFPV